MTDAWVPPVLLIPSRFFDVCFILLSWTLLSVGCGSVGEPLPPLLNIPERSHDFSARQVENQLVLEWTWPRLTTEGMRLEDLARFVVHAAEIARPEQVPPLDTFERESRELFSLAGDRIASYKAGEKVKLVLSATEMQGKTMALAVRGESGRGRWVGFSNIFVIEVIGPPGKPDRVRARIEPDAVVLEWEPAPGADSYQVLRAAEASGPFRDIGRTGGQHFRDPVLQWNQPYFYRIKSFASGRTGEVEGAASDVGPVVPEDRFAPVPPRGLVAVVGRSSVELSWSYNREPDLAGYRIRRGQSRETLASPAEGLLDAANYTDRDVEPGQTYFYSVSAVDGSGNESEPSEIVSVTLP